MSEPIEREPDEAPTPKKKTGFDALPDWLQIIIVLSVCCAACVVVVTVAVALLCVLWIVLVFIIGVGWEFGNNLREWLLG